MTNKKIDQHLENNPGITIGNKYLYSFSLTEMYGFLGLIILTGVFRANKEPINELYSEDPNKSRPIFKATMQRERLKAFLRFIRFDDQTTRLERIKIDKLAPIRWVFEQIASLLFKYYSPGTNLTIDERLARYRGKCTFRQYIPSKPGKYGIKIWIIADAKTHYILNIEVYLGKQNLSNKTEDLVYRLCENLRSGQIIVGDNYFTSLHLIEKLLSEKKILYYGTLRKNRREIPKIMKNVKGLPVFSSNFISYKGNLMVSYVPKKNRNVLLLSNVHNSTQLTDNVKRKPLIIQDYNRNKSGVDSLDQKIMAFRPYRTTKRWPCVIFYDLLAYAMHASWVIYCLKYPDSSLVKYKNRKEFLYQLTHQLVTPLIKARKSSPDYKYLHRDVKLSMDFMIALCEDSITKTNSLLETSKVAKSGNIPNLPFVEVPLSTEAESGSLPHLPFSEVLSNTEAELGGMPSILHRDIPQSIEAETGGMPHLPFSEVPQSSEVESRSTFRQDSLINTDTPAPTSSNPGNEISVADVQAKNLSRGRCFFCRRSKDKKVKRLCYSCNTLVCLNHSKIFVICLQCEDKISFI